MNMEEELEFNEETYATEDEIREFQETFEKFREIYGKVNKLTQTGIDNETKDQNEVRINRTKQ